VNFLRTTNRQGAKVAKKKWIYGGKQRNF